MPQLNSKGIVKSQIGPKTTSPTPNGSLYNNGPWSDNLATTSLTGSMLNRDKTKRALKNRPTTKKDLPEVRPGEPAVSSGRRPAITKDMPELRPGDNPKRQVLFNALKQK